jgi:hypothetical protein
MRVFLKRRDMPQRAVCVSRRQEGLDGVTMKPEMVVSDGPVGQHLLSFSEKRRPFGRIFDGSAESACHFRAAQLRSGFAADRQGFAQHGRRIVVPALVKQNPRLHFDRLRFEAPCLQLARETHRPLDIGLHRLVLAELIACENAHRFAEHFRAGLPDQRRRPGRLVAIRFRKPGLVEIKSAEADHRSIRDLDTPETVLAAQGHAAAEVFERRPHPPLGIRRVSKTAERARLRLGRSRSPRLDQAAVVLLPATINLP